MTDLADVSITSDKDYLKIAADGTITISANAAVGADSTFPADPSQPSLAGSTTITHGLGSLPLVRAFWDKAKNNTWYNAYCTPMGTKVDPWLKVLTTTDTLKLIMNTDGAAKTNIPVYYRIYDLTSHSFSSDERIDKIFKKDTANKIVATAISSLDPAYASLIIPHGQAEAPIFSIQFSEDNSHWYQEGTQIVGGFDTTSGPPGGPYARYYYTSAYAAVDATNLYLYFESNYDTGPKTIYVRYELDYRT